jgi:hypothetical protein
MSSPEQLREQARNDLLRRVDWRFLLRHGGKPRTSASFDGNLTSALALVSDKATVDEQPDLVVLVNPDRHALAAAATALAPGGTFYAEWYRPQLGGRARLGRCLESAGLEDIRWYWPWPQPSRGPAFWLPVDSPEALSYFLAQRRRAAALQRRLLAAVWPWALRLRLLVPLCAVAGKPGGSADGVEAAVQHHSSGGTLSWILLSGGRRSVNKVVGLPVAQAAARPELVVKFARSEEEEELLRHESHVLHLLSEARPDLDGVPRALFLERRCGRLALGETALDGEPLIWSLERDTFDRLCSSVTEWLVALAGDGERHPPDVWQPRLVEQPLELFGRNFASVVSSAEIDRARAALSSLGALPLVYEQRDCAPWNVLLAGDRISLADWESAEPKGLPALDLVYFLTNAALLVAGVLDSGPIAPWYADSLDPRTDMGSTVARCEAQYCERVGIDIRLLPVLRLLCWTIHARSEYQRFELDVAARPSPDVLATSLFLELWRAELERLAS